MIESLENAVEIASDLDPARLRWSALQRVRRAAREEAVRRRPMRPAEVNGPGGDAAVPSRSGRPELSDILLILRKMIAARR